MFPKIACSSMLKISAGDQIIESLTFGTGFSREEAVLKSLAEAQERFYSANFRPSLWSKPSRLEGHWIHPNLLVPKHPMLKQFRPDQEDFDENLVHPWYLANYLHNNQEVFILADQVNFPLNLELLGRGRCSKVSSNGVAAHTSYKDACNSALYELIERDALMLAWYTNYQVSQIPTDFLSPSIQYRIKMLKKQGRKALVLNLSPDDVPVVLVLILSESNYPCLSAGASSSNSFEKAIEKAFDEAQFHCFSWSQIPENAIDPESVNTPHDHGLLFAHTTYHSALEKFLHADYRYPREPKSEVDLIEMYKPISVVLHKPVSQGELWVVRILSEYLIPITFGYSFEPFGHQRVYSKNLEWTYGYPAIPHFFA